ncbi:CHAT domain-containing protein [Mycobacterium sp. PS03-16]|uniref:CHAT domain-containing protein n=1 Tax=Mycobacterium sp. PS03-16 TaxID=2559611 RepID=UPI0010734B0E|nr:CHAT domain-containing protein [Mycobacterium sp. PS03-16]TFV55939.1 CHAT domain-containing protein [Mycobacterium sp. PS03-16]
MAVSGEATDTLVLRFADVGIATYGVLRVVGQPSRTVTWVVEVPLVLAARQELVDALPEPHGGESRRDALERAMTRGPFSSPVRELTLSYILGVLLLGAQAWALLSEYADTSRPALFVSPSARLAGVPWGLLAVPTSGPTAEELVRARAEAMTRSGPAAAHIPWQLADIDAHTDGRRLMELADVFMAVPPNIVHAQRTPARWEDRRDAPPLLVLDPRVPGQRPDSALGSVLGRPSDDSPAVRYVEQTLRRRPALPETATAAQLFRRTDVDRDWLAGMLARGPSRLLYVGHATVGDDGGAERAALYLAEPAALTAAGIIARRLPMPPRVALLACASGGDYRFDEASGLVSAMILSGAQTVTATLWSLPTTAGHREFRPADDAGDPMADIIAAVDTAHEQPQAGRAVNDWQRERLRQWRAGDAAAGPLHWAALVTFAVDGTR